MQKALILIAVPLAFELILLSVLAGLLYESEKEAKAADRARSVIAQSNAVIQDLFDVSFAFLAYDASTNEFFKQRLDAVLKRLPADSKRLSDLVADHSNQAEIVQKALAETKEPIAWIISSSRKTEAGERLNIQEALEMRNQLNKIVSELDVIIKEEKQAQKKNPHAAEQMKAGIKIVLLTGVLASIMIAGLLAFLFNRNTSNRLSALMLNSKRLGQRESLAPVLEGDDEIATLDRTFHAAADAIAESDRKRDELEQLKRQFVAMVSHDLRSPLSAVSSTLSLLQADAWGTLNEQGKSKVAKALISLRHSIELINNLLDLEKMESGALDLQVEKTSLAKILGNSIEAVSALAESKGIEIRLPEEDHQVWVDEFRLTQVFMNLLSNAIKFAPEKSQIKVSFICESRQLKVCVEDEGPGVPESEAVVIFERYRQASESGEKKRQGTGLGLAICKAIVEAHKGEIGYLPAQIRGSIFWFTLPLDSGEDALND